MVVSSVENIVEPTSEALHTISGLTDDNGQFVVVATKLDHSRPVLSSISCAGGTKVSLCHERFSLSSSMCGYATSGRAVPSRSSPWAIVQYLVVSLSSTGL